MRIAICDDEHEWINKTEECINKFKKIYNDISYEIFTSGEELLTYYDKNGNAYEIVIIDIEMAGISGIETAQKIRDRDNDVIIFFLTSHKEYVYDSFRPMPMNFWIKPIDYKIFKEDIMRAQKRIKHSASYLKIIENRNKIRLKCADIIYIENKERKSYIYTKSHIYKTNKLLSELLKELDNDIFVRTYKSFIINLRYVRIISENVIILYNTEEEIPISRTYKSELINKYINLKEKEYC